MAVPIGSSAKGATFGAFQRRVASFRVAGVALPGIPTCFRTRQNRFVWQAHYFCNFFQRCIAFFVAGAALWTPPMSFCVAGAALSTSRAACFLRIALSALREVVTRCKFRGRRGIL